jgi:hypothetical protein
MYPSEKWGVGVNDKEVVDEESQNNRVDSTM